MFNLSRELASLHTTIEYPQKPVSEVEGLFDRSENATVAIQRWNVFTSQMVLKLIYSLVHDRVLDGHLWVTVTHPGYLLGLETSSLHLQVPCQLNQVATSLVVLI